MTSSSATSSEEKNGNSISNSVGNYGSTTVGGGSMEVDAGIPAQPSSSSMLVDDEP